jgi:transposase-like protein
MKKVNRYSDTFKRKVVSEALTGPESLEYYRRKYKLGGSMTLSRWISIFEGDIKSGVMAKQGSEKELEVLKAELELLKRELDHERLKRQAYELMIKIAEEEYKIPIEKKYGVKQSKK